MPRKLVTGVWGDVTKWFTTDADGDRTPYRGMTQNCTPIMDDVQRRAQARPGRFSRKGEHEYVGTIPRAMLDDWLRARGKTWHDYAIDRDLKRAFTLFMTAERPRFFAKNWDV